jgi:wyosine [tRNA(Phe)-imidazoG37] synthetase (radical SAM superfamily)
MEIFGPIPSRRLGRSLGINNIPPKSCSYSCTYCQVGAVATTEIKRRGFYAPEYLFKLVNERVVQARERGEIIDYLSFVPEGEPTLDTHLGDTIELLRPLGIKIAIISNGSLIWREEIRETLKKLDWVCLKVDTVTETLWHRLNKSHGNLKLAKILDGMLTFAQEFTGTLATDTMLVKGVNVGEESAYGVADFLGQLKPDKAYLLIPTRPPAESDVSAPSEEEVNRFYQIVSRKVPTVECLGHYEGNAFASTGNVASDLLSITAVHPMREEAVRELLANNRADWSIVQLLLKEGKLKETVYQGNKFYVRW